MQPPRDSIALVITEIEAFGGAERSLLALSNWLHEHGYANHVLTYQDKIGLSCYASHPLQVIQLKPQGGVRAKVRAMKGAITSESPRPIVSGYQPALHCTLAGVRGFHTLMHDTPSLFGDEATRNWKAHLRIRISNQIIGYGLRSGGATTVNSEYLRAECKKDFGIDTTIVRMGGLSGANTPIAHPVGDTLRMLSVCRIEENKRLDWLLRALAAMESAQPPLSQKKDWRLDLLGKGSLIEPLTKLANDLRIGDRIHFHGFVTDEVLEEYFQNADLFLMPAVQGYGIPALEALQRGVPVMLHRESGVSDLLLDTPWATVMHGGESATVPALSQAIDSILQGKHLGITQPKFPTEEEWAQQVCMLFGYPPRA